MSSDLKAVITQPGESKNLEAFGDILIVMLNGEQTNQAFSIMSMVTPPGGGPPLHIHNLEDEIFLVAEGRISYFVNGQWTEVAVGGSVFLPQGLAHCYRNIGSIPSKHWIITIPSGFENFFERCAQEFKKSNPPDMEQIIHIHRDYGIKLIPNQSQQFEG